MTSRTRRRTGLGLAAALLTATQTPQAAPSPLVPQVVGLCNTFSGTRVEQLYTITGRIKLLLVWTGRRSVGNGRFIRTEASDGASRLELLLGTDPETAPMRLNRWGYIAETTCDAGTMVTGVMTESNEQSVDQAQAREKDKQHHPPLRAIRSRVLAAETTTETATILPARLLTYRDADEALSLMPASAAVVQAAMPAQAESGFLRAVTSLLRESVVTRTSPPGRPLRRAYVYAGTVYEMAIRRSKATRTGAGASELESDFQVKNSRTGGTTEFQISYAAGQHGDAIARRIVFRPRWWLELELLLSERGR